MLNGQSASFIFGVSQHQQQQQQKAEKLSDQERQRQQQHADDWDPDQGQSVGTSSPHQRVSSSYLAAAAAAAAVAHQPAPTPFMLGSQQFLLTPPPPGVQLMTIPASLATLPGSDQIPVIATSTGQLILANIISVPRTSAAAAVAAAAAAAAAAACAANSGGCCHGDDASSSSPAEQSTTATTAATAVCNFVADNPSTNSDDCGAAEADEDMDNEMSIDRHPMDEDAPGAAAKAGTFFGEGDDELNKHTVNQITDSNVVDGVDLEDIREFAKQFKLRRLSLGLTQTQVGTSLSVAKGPAYSQSAICRFEKLDITPKSAAKIKPVLEAWIAEAEEKFRLAGSGGLGGLLGGLSGLTAEDQQQQHHQQQQQQQQQQHFGSFDGLSAAEAAKKMRKRRTSFTPTALEILNEYFEHNTHPTGAQMTELAKSLRYEREVIRVWFCNKRQALKNTVKRLQRPDEISHQQHSQQQQQRVTAVSAATTSKAAAAAAAAAPTSASMDDSLRHMASLVSPFAYRSQAGSSDAVTETYLTGGGVHPDTDNGASLSGHPSPSASTSMQ